MSFIDDLDYTARRHPFIASMLVAFLLLVITSQTLQILRTLGIL